MNSSRAFGVRNTPWIVVCLLTSTLVSGCALHKSVASVPAPGDHDDSGSLSRYIAAVNRATVGSRQPRAAEAERLEHQDADLFMARAAVEVAPTAEHHRQLAEAYARRGVLDAAFDHFTAALKMSSKDAASFEGRARVWRDWGTPQLGLNDAHWAIFRAPALPGPRNTLGTLLLKMGLLNDARQAFEAALARDPRASYALNNLCYLHLLEGQNTVAVDTCRDALTIDPESRIARNNLALAYAALGDTAAAFHEFSVGGGAATASYNMGIALAAVGRFPDAARAFDTAAAIDPRLSDARERARSARVMAARSTVESGR